MQNEDQRLYPKPLEHKIKKKPNDFYNRKDIAPLLTLWALNRRVKYSNSHLKNNFPSFYMMARPKLVGVMR